MRIHHINCGSMRPFSVALVNGTGPLTERGTMVCHCLLVETDEGLVLVDAGIGHDDINSTERFGLLFDAFVGPIYDPAETAVSRVRQLGYDPADVRHIILTHLDIDHAGGLPDFPHARVHVDAREFERANNPRSLRDRGRYLQRQWAHGVDWQLYSGGGEEWHGLEARLVRGISSAQFLLVPLYGHSAGHCGVALATGDEWLLHCGDAYFCRGQVDPTEAWCTPGSAFFQSSVEDNHSLRMRSQARLQSLARHQTRNVTLLCSHDSGELALFLGDGDQ